MNRYGRQDNDRFPWADFYGTPKQGSATGDSIEIIVLVGFHTFLLFFLRDPPPNVGVPIGFPKPTETEVPSPKKRRASLGLV